jgi:hypothetical protein
MGACSSKPAELPTFEDLWPLKPVHISSLQCAGIATALDLWARYHTLDEELLCTVQVLYGLDPATAENCIQYLKGPVSPLQHTFLAQMPGGHLLENNGVSGLELWTLRHSRFKRLLTDCHLSSAEADTVIQLMDLTRLMPLGWLRQTNLLASD